MDPSSRQTPLSPRRSFVAPPVRRPNPVPVAAPAQPIPASAPEAPVYAAPQPIVTIPTPAIAVVPEPTYDSDLITPQTVSLDPVEPPKPAEAAPPKRFGFIPTGKRAMIAFAAFGILFIGLGGTAAAYYGMVVPSRPDNVLLEALAHNFDGTIKSATFKGTSSAGDYSASFSGAYKNDGSYRAHADYTYADVTVGADVVNPDGKTVYGRLNGLPGLAGNQTFKADAEKTFFNNLFSSYAPVVMSSNAAWYRHAVAPHRQDDEAGAKLAAAYTKHPFLKLTATYNPEVINGQPSDRMRVAVDGTMLKDFLISLKDSHLENLQLSQDQLSLLNMNIDTVKFDKYPVDIWIQKDRKIINQVAITGDTQKTLVTFSDFNKPVTIEAPTDATEYDSLREQVRSINASSLLTSAGMLNGETTGLDVIIMTALQ